MSIIYPSKQLKIMDYNRVITSLNGLSSSQFLDSLSTHGFNIVGKKKLYWAMPTQKHRLSLFLEGTWYSLQINDSIIPKLDPVKSLDVQLLNDHVLGPILGISDLRNDKRIDFVGGIRGLRELEKRCKEDCVAAFAMHPVVIDDLMSVADAGMIMPPKSTWFEPKPRSGFVVRVFDHV